MQLFEEFFDQQQQQQLQQQKLLEFQQRSKRIQVEKVLPLEDCVDYESFAPQSSALYIGQRLLVLKQIQQKQQYEHQLQQQYENRSIIEESYVNDSKLSQQLHENEIANNDTDELNYGSHNISMNFTLSPETDSNYVDIDSSYPIKFIDNDLNLRSEVKGNSDKLINPISMPFVEDRLSREHESEYENNNVKANIGELLKASSDDIPTCNTFRKPALETLNVREPFKIEETFNSRKGSDFNTEHVHIQQRHQTAHHTLDHQSSQKIEDNNNIHTSKYSDASANVTKIKLKTDDIEADTDLETDRLLGEQRELELQEAFFENNQVRYTNVY